MKTLFLIITTCAILMGGSMLYFTHTLPERIDTDKLAELLKTVNTMTKNTVACAVASLPESSKCRINDEGNDLYAVMSDTAQHAEMLNQQTMVDNNDSTEEGSIAAPPTSEPEDSSTDQLKQAITLLNSLKVELTDKTD